MSINLNLTKEELNTILHGLYSLEDKSWFFDPEGKLNTLIEKLNKIDLDHQNELESLCDI